MTITTAKKPGRALVLTPLALAALLLSAECRADWKFTPTVGATETYTDNPSLQRSDLAHGQFVSEAMAGFGLTENTSRLRLSAFGRVHQFAYSDGSQPNLNDREHDYGATALARLTDDVFLDLAASGGPQAISAFGPQVSDNLYSMGNRTTVTTWRISPYVQHHYGNAFDMLLRYSRDSVDAGASNLFGSSTANVASLNLSSGAAFHNVGWGFSYLHQDTQNRLAGPSSFSTAQGNLSLPISPRLSATASAGYDKYDYQSLGGRTAGRNWSVGFVWTPSSRTRLQASAGRHYYGKTGALAFSHQSRHSVWNINYGDAITTSRQQFLLPSGVDTAGLVDTLFKPSIPDPVLRAQAVQAYLLSTGLPSSLANNVNYLSNRYLRQKQLQGAVGFNWAHSSLLTTVYRTERTALSVRQSDSELLSNALGNLNDNVRQRGVSSVFTYRLSPRTNAIAAAELEHVTSLDTGIGQKRRVVRAGMARKFDRHMNFALDVRHVQGGTDTGAFSTYRENALSASISAQF